MATQRWLLIIAFFCTTVFIIYTIHQFYTAENVAIPQYQILHKKDDIEIRRYAPMIMASVNVDADERVAINQGFRRLASFIFGDNTDQAKATPQQIKMTAPVMQQGKASNHWRISFVMPSEYTLTTLPQPNDKTLEIDAIPTQDWIVIRFSGRWHGTKRTLHLQNLQTFAKNNELKTTSDSPVYAYYNPPWTLPFMRRNEIMLLLDKDAFSASGLKSFEIQDN